MGRNNFNTEEPEKKKPRYQEVQEISGTAHPFAEAALVAKFDFALVFCFSFSTGKNK